MNRSVYSLVLMDRVVEEIDRLAYQNNTSRSALINKILAEYVSCITPEQRMLDIFAEMKKQIQEIEALQIMPMVSDLQLGLRSALQYRYNPIIHYSVVLYRRMQPYFGELRISSRTQSKPLMDALSSFFHIWVAVEEKYIADHFDGDHIPCQIGPGKFTRELLFPKEVSNLTNEMLADAISRYIQTFDAALKSFFTNDENDEIAIRKTEQMYYENMEEQEFVI